MRLKAFVLPGWLPYTTIAVFVCTLAVIFLSPSPVEFPMDDTYIHFVYARNLAETGRLFFNEIGETGVGSTSLLWVVLLAGAYKLGIPVYLAAKTLGVLSLILAGWGMFRLFQVVLSPNPALLLTLLICGSGHFIWFTLSGMETMLFLALSLAAILLYQQKQWALLGIALGLVVLTRPDGLALLGAFLTIEALKILAAIRPEGLFRSLKQPVVRSMLARAALTVALCLMLCGPWFLYLFFRTGHFLPTSAIGKQTSSMLALSVISERSSLVGALLAVPGIIYAGAWVVYLLEFVLGGIALPGPQLQALNVGGNAGYTISWLALAGWLLVVLPLSIRFFKSLAGFIRRRAYVKEQYRPLLVLAAWIFLHNLMYALFLPIPGTASRYGVANHVALWLMLALGLRALWQDWAGIRARAGRWAAPIATAGLLIIALANTAYWNRVYDANLEHMQNVRIAAAQFIQTEIGPNQVIAAFDIGAIRYFTGRPVVDLGGLVDPNLGIYFKREGRIDRYLAERGVNYVVLPGQTGKTDEGWFDFAREMGLTDSRLFSLELVEVFAIDHERWLLGYLPTNNYQATVTIYQLRYR